MAAVNRPTFSYEYLNTRQYRARSWFNTIHYGPKAHNHCRCSIPVLLLLISTFFQVKTTADDYTDGANLAPIVLNTTSSGADVPETLVNFPVLIRIAASNKPTDDFFSSQTLNNGQDIRFFKTTGKRLAHEIERWESSNELAEIWVLVDTVYGDNNTQFFNMYWGKPDAADSSEGSAVFDTANGFGAVLHLAEDPSGNGVNALKDATGNGHHGTPFGEPSLCKGVVGHGLDLETQPGIDHVIIGHTAHSNSSGSFTVSSWVNTTMLGSWYQPLISKFEFGNDWGLGWIGTGILGFYMRAGSGNQKARSQTEGKGLDGAWHLLTGVARNDSVHFYIDGEVEQSLAWNGGETWPDNTADVGLGWHTTNHFGDARMDEVRISRTARSGAWIKLCYASQRENQTLVQITNTPPLVGSLLFQDPPFLQIFQLVPGYRNVQVHFRVQDNQSDSVAIGNFGYSLDSGRTWSPIPDTAAALERKWSSNLVQSAPDFQYAADYSILIKTEMVAGDIFKGRDLSGVMVRLTAAQPSQKENITAVSKPFRVDNKPPSVVFDTISTSNTRPDLSGSSDEKISRVELEINNKSFSAEISADSLHWTLAGNTLPQLNTGVYTVVINAWDKAENPSETSVEKGVTIIKPGHLMVSVTPLTTTERSPEIRGTVSDTAAEVTVSIGEETFPASIGLNGGWRIPRNTFKKIMPGIYNVEAKATTTNGASANDSTTEELVILDTVNIVTINDVYANNSSPEFSGTVNTDDAVVTLEILLTNQGVYQVLESLSAVNSGNGVWRLDSGKLQPLPEGTLAAAVTAAIPGGNSKTDTALVTIDLTPPVVGAFTPASSSKILYPEVNWSQNEDLLSSTLSWMDCETGKGTCDGKDTVLTGELLKAGNHRVTMPEGTLSSGASYTVKLTLVDLAGNAADTAHHQVTLYSGVMGIEFPENSKKTKSDFQIQILEAPNYPAGMLPVGPAILFEKNGDNQNWKIGEPVLLQFKILNTTLSDSALKKAAIYKSLPEQTGGWTRIPSELKEGWIEAETETLGSFIAAVDTLPPRLNVLSLNSTVTAGEAIDVSAEIRDNIANPTAFIHVQMGGGADSLIPMQKGDSLSQGTIPGSWSSKLGLWYTIKASDGVNTVSSDTVDVSVEMAGPLTPGNALKLKEGSYQMFSIPLQPERNTVSNILNDDLGETDKKRWRLFVYETEFTEMKKDDAILPARAYWLRTRDFTPDIDVDEVKISTLPVSRPLALPLNAGWNCIANPFSFPITPADLRTSDGGKVDQLWERSGGNWLTKAEITAVEPWRGYVVWNGREKISDSLFIYPWTHSAKAAKSAASRSAVRISLSVSDGYFQDGLAVLGFGATGAQNGKDKWDCIKPGIFSQPIELSLQVGWDTKSPYLTDIREALDNGQSWHFSLHLGKEAAKPTLSFTGLATLPAGVRAELLDRTSGQSLPLSGKPLPYPGGKQKSVNTFEVAVGDIEYLAKRRAQFKLETTKFELGRISPNPFSRRTVIYYSLPWNQNGLTPVSLRIIDTKGRIVQTLVDESQAPGRHSTVWTLAAHGTPIPSGSYFCLLTAGELRAVKKLVVLQ